MKSFSVVSKEGLCLINIGNSHTVAFLLFEGRVLGIYEHHTGNMTPEKLWFDSQLFRKGDLKFEKVFDRLRAWLCNA